MVDTALSSRLDTLFDRRWRPRLQLSSAERDNLFRWDGQPGGHFETYMVKVQLPQEGAALWLRHELRFSKTNKIAPSLRVIALLFDHRSGETKALAEDFPLSELDFGRQRFWLKMGPCELSQSGAKGSLGGGALTWDLRWEPRRISARPLLWNALYETDAIPSKILIPNAAVPTWGQVFHDGRNMSAKGGRAQQAHLWGRQSPLRWMSTQVDAFAGRSDCGVEAYQVQDRIVGVTSPWAMSVRVTYRHHTYFFPRVMSDLEKGGAAHRLDGWDFSCGRGPLHFIGHLKVDPDSLVGVRSEDPDGRPLRIATAASASMQLEVLRRGGLKFHREVLLSAPQLAWYELVATELASSIRYLL